jgi:hypothetical protein
MKRLVGDSYAQESTGINKSPQKSTNMNAGQQFSLEINILQQQLGAACMECRRIIGEGHGYWKIKGWGHFVVYFRLNFLDFLRFAWYHFKQTVVPPWYRG